jgi:hypothetical protein
MSNSTHCHYIMASKSTKEDQAREQARITSYARKIQSTLADLFTDPTDDSFNADQWHFLHFAEFTKADVERVLKRHAKNPQLQRAVLAGLVASVSAILARDFVGDSQ